MAKITKVSVSPGVFWVEVPEAGAYVLCGCPADSVKHLMKRGLVVPTERDGVHFETGPNVILLSDVTMQNGAFANLAEFPVLQMLYRQGMILPNHPNNTGARPMLVGSHEQVRAQMDYIYRGNYGLVSEEEMRAAGLSDAEASAMMRLKLKFAYGKIRSSEELLDLRIIGDNAVDILGGVTVRRLSLNMFEFAYAGERVQVDLNLAPTEAYEAAYPLGYHQIGREYFAVVHSGQGDGWDVNRPTMSSMLMFQGRVYLIDAGPNILHSLNALGVSVSGIEGIFHTHAHDDHFCGLTSLMRSDHKLKYYAAPAVRASVEKKLSALLSWDQSEFEKFFEVCDLIVGEWNDIAGLGVRPVWSPHPVETTIFTFRANGPERPYLYGHFADIVSLDTLEQMRTDDATKPGVSLELCQTVKQEYLKRTDLKKLDIGGGLIHGAAEDFRGDESEKIVLAHVARDLTDEEKEIGSGAAFGMTDTLVASHQDYIRRRAESYLSSYFPEVPLYEIDVLLNNPIETWNPETIVLRAGSETPSVYLVLTGNMEMLHSESGVRSMISVGGLVGEDYAIAAAPVRETYRAVSYVQTLVIPSRIYHEFVTRCGIFPGLEGMRDCRKFLMHNWLFGDSISYSVTNRLVRAVESRQADAGSTLAPSQVAGLSLIRSGVAMFCSWKTRT